MSRYLRFNDIKGLGYQIVARDAYNQTFVFYAAPPSGVYKQEFNSDLNYQLVVL